jgi:hypothetical protein
MNFASSSMRPFPSEFSEFLTPLGRRALRGSAPEFRSMFKKTGVPFTVLQKMIDRNKARAAVKLLDRHVHPWLAVETSRIPADSISSMKENYTESLPKVLRFKTAFLGKRTARPYKAAEALGLLAMLRSDSLKAFAEMITGQHLIASPSVQVICYEHGDYVGPHNDYHPEEDPKCVGFVDLHVMLSNHAVAHQFLIYERSRHLSQIVDVNLEAGISVYKLPFWHQVTPLVGKPGREHDARRWLLLATFDIAENAKG